MTKLQIRQDILAGENYCSKRKEFRKYLNKIGKYKVEGNREAGE